ncbi:hypothetical protein SNK03_004313 [Fusarium graminearum]
MPYAQPPTGERRWRIPVPLPESYVYGTTCKPFDATDFGAVCPQKSFQLVEAAGRGGRFSEDCLFVNIWTPVPRDNASQKKPWPVMLWMHGGWFQMGNPSHEPVMDSVELISTGKLNAVVVAIGYRLNIFGFLAAEALHEESNGASAGNFGLWDQRLGAQWVQDNIAAFGGDPTNVTLAGRSAGSFSSQVHMLHDLRDASRLDCQEPLLYRRVFMDSNSMPSQPKTVAESQEQFDEVCDYFKIDSSLHSSKKLEILRSKTAEELSSMIPTLKNHFFWPVTDDLFIQQGIMEYIESPEFAAAFQSKGLKLLISEVENEETLYANFNAPTEPTIESLRAMMSNYYTPEVIDRVLALPQYPLPTNGDLMSWRNHFGQIVSDGQVRAPGRCLVENLLRHDIPISDIWRCKITYRLSFITEKFAPLEFGVAHAGDKPIWNFVIQHGPTDEERQLMKDWIKLLAAFVQDDRDYKHGTTTPDEMVVMTADRSIEVQKDTRWRELLEVGRVFAGTA